MAKDEKTEVKNTTAAEAAKEEQQVATQQPETPTTPDGNPIAVKEKFGVKLKRKVSGVMNHEITFTPAQVVKGVAAAGAAVGGTILALKLKAKMALGSDPGADPGADPEMTPDSFDEPSEL